jgi:hypothetical protein
VVAFLVGHFAARKNTGSFDWELASVFGTALGTTLLALATGALAFTTSGDVRATWELARLTGEDQERRELPLVLVQHAEVESREAHPVPGTQLLDHVGWLRMSLRNVGLGSALRVEVTTHYIYADLQPTAIEPAIVPTIPAGDEQWANVVVRFRTADWTDIKGDGFPVEGTYLGRTLRTEYPILAKWDEKVD